MRVFLYSALVALICACGASAQAPSSAACGSLPKVAASPEVTAKVRGQFLNKGRILVQDLYLQTPDGKQTRAYLIRPRQVGPNPGAVFFVHLLGPPPDNDREEFFEDAIELAESNVISLLVDTPWADPEWFTKRKLDEDFANVLSYASQLEGEFKYLVSTSKAAPEKIAFVGHDFGAMYGTLLLRDTPSIRHAVVMTPVPDFADWFLLGKKLPAAEEAAYRKKMEPLKPANYLRCSSADILFQFAEADHFVNKKQATELVDSAPKQKQVMWYPGEHELQNVSRKDRVEWLRQKVGTAPATK